jgi:hypothetical protein
MDGGGGPPEAGHLRLEVTIVIGPELAALVSQLELQERLCAAAKAVRACLPASRT